MSVKPIKLSDVTQDIEIAPPGCNTYYDKRTGELHPIGDEEWGHEDDDKPLEEFPEWQRDAIAALREVAAGSDDYICLPERDDVDEYAMMEDFCASLTGREVSERLFDAIRGKGAFGRFRDQIQRLGVADEWYAFRERRLADFARGWCRENNLPFIDDGPSAEEREDSSYGAFYDDLADQLCRLLAEEPNLTARAANMAALVYHALADVNWVGFYVLDGDELVLGPFQGKPACARIGLAQGVCGAAARMGESLVVDNVHEFPGHIACDPESKSELVVPILFEERLWGVFDLDSPRRARFKDEDRKGVEALARVFVDAGKKK